MLYLGRIVTNCCLPEYTLEARESLRRWTLRSDHFCIHTASRSDGSILGSIIVNMGENDEKKKLIKNEMKYTMD